MISPLRDQLQAGLGDAYILQQELGGGGMSRVFVAHEVALGRDIVVKLLAPELAEGLSADRFAREIRLAASLQAPHIVPLLTAGSTPSGLPFYTMPFVTGRSLRERIDAGAVPREEALSILRDVLKALAFAHSRGVVHRDIKPENVLLTAGTAMVTDFGIAKALRAAKDETPVHTDAHQSMTLTGVGMSLGTPAYMSPEQATGEAVDHRADLYAWGVMAYEVLAGRHPFAGRASAHAIVAAHIAEPPPSMPAEVPAPIADVVMQALSKAAEERPASADALLAALDTARDASLRTPLPSRDSLVRALAGYVVAVVLVSVATPRLMDVLGLPDWVLPAAFGLTAVGLPLALLTPVIRRQKRSSASVIGVRTSEAPLGTRRVVRVGSTVLGAFTALVALWMGLRALGIGPAGSLLAAGRLSSRDTVVVADFRVAGPDSALGPVMAEAVRTDLSQSRAIAVAPVSQLVAALRRMERDPSQPFTTSLASEVAQREGMKAVVAGELTPIGNGYVVTLRLQGAASGDVLASFQSTADAPSALIPTIQTLTRKLRGKIGESLTAVRADPPLDRVTTASLPALRKASEALHAQNVEGDYLKAAGLFREAVALDSTFAFAWRGLAVALSSMGIDQAAQDTAFVRAYRYRDRLPERERLRVTADYFRQGAQLDRQKSAEAYRALLEIDPTDAGVLGTYGEMLVGMHRWAEAETMLQRAAAAQPGSLVAALVVSHPMTARGRLAAAESTLAAARARWPGNASVDLEAALFALNTRNLDSAATISGRLLADTSSDSQRALAAAYLYRIASMRGQPAEAERMYLRSRELWRASGDPDKPLSDAMNLAKLDLWIRESPAAAVARLDRALAAHPITRASSISDISGAVYAAAVYATAGAGDRARSLLATVESVADAGTLRRFSPERARVRAELALAGGNGNDALRLFRLIDRAPDGGPESPCETCFLPDFARSFERAGIADSARVMWQRYVDTPALFVSTTDVYMYAYALQRLSALFDGAGNAAMAARYRQRYAALRRDAEPAGLLAARPRVP